MGIEVDLRRRMEGHEIEDMEREINLALHYISHAYNAKEAYRQIIKAIEEDIPIPYAIGYTLVKGLPITISNKVLHPGPETVTLVEASIAYINSSRARNVLDLCTGSGAVAIAISKFCNAEVTATDISIEALVVAKENAKRNKTDVEFLHGDLLQPVRERKFDCIVTNPPYVKTDAILALPKFVKDFAPKIAIDGGIDGLSFHKQILEEVGEYLTSGGSLFLECENDQDKEIELLIAINGWRIEETYPNRFGKIRGFRLRKV